MALMFVVCLCCRSSWSINRAHPSILVWQRPMITGAIMAEVILRTGAELAAHIEKEAAMRGLSPSKLLAQIYPNPAASLNTIRRARQPTINTIAKLNRILSSKVMMARADERTNAAHMQRLATIATKVDPVYVDRDPCFYCGTRADIGCRHQESQHG